MPARANGFSTPATDAAREPGTGACSSGVLLAPASGPALPDYLQRVYAWAYLNQRSTAWLDRCAIVNAILFGNQARLRRSTFDEFEPGQHVLHTGSVYGDFSAALARHLGPAGHLEVIDVAPIQVANCRRKLAQQRNANVRLANAEAPGNGPYDAVCCFFLLHELPARNRRRVVRALLSSVSPGGRVVFVDYHRPAPLHPLRPLMKLIFERLEPFAIDLWHHSIEMHSGSMPGFSWQQHTSFGGLYQKVVATRIDRARDAVRGVTAMDDCR